MVQWLFSVRYEFKHSLHVVTALKHFASDRSETVKTADVSARKKEYGDECHWARNGEKNCDGKAVSKVPLLLVSA